MEYHCKSLQIAQRIPLCEQSDRIARNIVDINFSYEKLKEAHQTVVYNKKLLDFLVLQLEQIKDSCAFLDRQEAETSDCIQIIADKCTEKQKQIHDLLIVQSGITGGISLYTGEKASRDAKRQINEIKKGILTIQKLRSDLEMLTLQKANMQTRLVSIPMRRLFKSFYVNSIAEVKELINKRRALFVSLYSRFHEIKDLFNCSLVKYADAFGEAGKIKTRQIAEAARSEFGDYKLMNHEVMSEGICSFPTVVKSSAFGGFVTEEQKVEAILGNPISQDVDKDEENQQTMRNLVNQFTSYKDSYVKHVSERVNGARNECITDTRSLASSSSRVERDENSFKVSPSVVPVLLKVDLPYLVDVANTYFTEENIPSLEFLIPTESQNEGEVPDVNIFSSKKRIHCDILALITRICVNIVENAERVMTQGEFRDFLVEKQDTGFSDNKKGGSHLPKEIFSSTCTLCRNSFVDPKFCRALKKGKQEGKQYEKSFQDRRSWPTCYGTVLCGCKTLKKCLWCTVVSWLFYGKYRMNRPQGRKRKRNTGIKPRGMVRSREFAPLVSKGEYPHTASCPRCKQGFHVNDILAVLPENWPKWRTTRSRGPLPALKKLIHKELHVEQAEPLSLSPLAAFES
jgi:hypothetical protein